MGILFYFSNAYLIFLLSFRLQTIYRISVEYPPTMESDSTEIGPLLLLISIIGTGKYIKQKKGLSKKSDSPFCYCLFR